MRGRAGYDGRPGGPGSTNGQRGRCRQRRRTSAVEGTKPVRTRVTTTPAGRQLTINEPARPCSESVRLVGEVDHDRSVIAGALALALLTVDERTGDPPGQCGGGEHEVDAHALAAGEAQLRVVP